MNIIRINQYDTSLYLKKQYFNFDNTNDFIDINVNNLMKHVEANKHKHKILDMLSIINEDEQRNILLLYNVYLFGGLLINDKIIINNIFNIIKIYDKYDMCCVKSCLFDNLFMGFIICKKSCNIINEIFDKYVTNNGSIKIMNLLYENLINNNNAIILTEQIISNVSNIIFDNNIISQHHFNVDNLENLVTDYDDVCISNLNNLTIGITFTIPTNIVSLYSNGIRQNALYLYELLKNIYSNVYLIIEKNVEQIFLTMFNNLSFFKYKYKILEEIYCDEYDLLISLSFELPKHIIINYKKRGKKIVAYCCGNSYIIDSELILYNHNNNLSLNNKYIGTFDLDYTYNQIWSIPQMYKQNKYYWETLYRCDCIEVPFIWLAISTNFFP